MKFLTKEIIIVILFILAAAVIIGRQDFVFGAGDFVFAFALLPMVIQDKVKPPVESSLLTGGVLTIFGAAFVTLDLWLSAIGCFVCGGTWLLLAAQTVDWFKFINSMNPFRYDN